VTPVSARTLSRRSLERELSALANLDRAKHSITFFKTGQGQYGEGDRFLGIAVPSLRRTALRYKHLSLDDLARLLASPIHEHRAASLEILVAQYERASPAERELIVDFYLQHATRANNWDLVDASAPYILGHSLLEKTSRSILDRLAGSANVWERRIAIVSTLMLLKHRETADTFRIAEKLLADKQDLIHKAVGWALREAGRISRPDLLEFLCKHYSRLPRTTLRYAIEHFPAEQRKKILNCEFAAGKPLRKTQA